MPGLIALAAGLAGFWWLGVTYGFIRAAIALAMGAAIFWLGLNYFRNAGLYPPEPEATDVSAYDLRYVCTMCGLELKVETATTDKAPSHCGEKMELVQAGGKPPLRPV